MSYAMGPAFNFPAFVATCNALDWKTAAAESHMSEAGNAGVAPRNVADRVLLLTARYMTDNNVTFDPSRYVVAGKDGVDLTTIKNRSTDDPNAALVTWIQNRLIGLGLLDQNAATAMAPSTIHHPSRQAVAVRLPAPKRRCGW